MGRTAEQVAENVAETVEAITSMRAAGKDWAFIAQSLGLKQNSLSHKFQRWRNKGFTDMAVPGTDTSKPLNFTPEAALELLGEIGFRDGWWQWASCRKPGVNPEIFYPIEGGTTRPAKRVCEECPVRAQCLEYALERNEQYGVWGGLSERERKALRKTKKWGERRAA